MATQHSVSTTTPASTLTPATDTIHQYWEQLGRLLLVRSILQRAVHDGNGDAITRVIKYLHLYFRKLKYPKYALACLEYTAQVELLLSPRVREVLKYERGVNRQGRPGKNMPYDLDVEHSNKVFKQRFTLYRGEPTAQMMYRISSSEDVTTQVVDILTDEWHLSRPPRADKKKSQEADAANVASKENVLRDERVMKPEPSRRFMNDKLNQAAEDPLLAIDMYALHGWYHAKVANMLEKAFFRQKSCSPRCARTCAHEKAPLCSRAFTPRVTSAHLITHPYAPYTHPYARVHTRCAPVR